LIPLTVPEVRRLVLAMDAPIFKVGSLTFLAMLLLAGMPRQSAPIDGRSPELYNV
jgi:hypothetical protein